MSTPSKQTVIMQLAKEAKTSAQATVIKSASATPADQQVIAALSDTTGLSKKASLAAIIGTGAVLIQQEMAEEASA